MQINHRKILWLTLAYFSIVLGTAGIFLPLLPTVPLLLLAVYAALRSSPRLALRLLNHKRLGPPLLNYLKYRSVNRSLKIKSLSFLWLCLLVSMMVIGTTWIRILLACVGIAVTIHIFSLRTKD
jgi:uncharacterized membrane protein YbaN (DUF454 family)